VPELVTLLNSMKKSNREALTLPLLAETGRRYFFRQPNHVRSGSRGVAATLRFIGFTATPRPNKPTAELWLHLQYDYDLRLAKRDVGAGLARIETINKPRAA
jgi:hypothetical protein